MTPIVLAKVVGARCNLRCSYCYYLETGGAGVLGPELLEAYLRQRFEVAGPGPVAFDWHGGEPTLAGLEWFRALVRLQKKLCPPGVGFTNSVQTNGLWVDDDWAAFWGDEGFQVGLSLDGAARHHDPWRPAADGGPTHARVLGALAHLQARRVPLSLLAVVHRGTVGDPEGVYRFLRQTGVPFLQFLPLVQAPHRYDEGLSVPAEAYGAFLRRVFDLWIAADVGTVVVQAFDEAFRTVVGAPHALCVHRPTCGDVVVLETDGGWYACDHFVDPDHRWGTLGPSNLQTLAADPRQRAFGEAKALTMAPECRLCPVLEFCHGGCPKDRDARGLNRLCPAYRSFFLHSRPALEALGAHWRSGRPLRAFRWEPRAHEAAGAQR